MEQPKEDDASSRPLTSLKPKGPIPQSPPGDFPHKLTDSDWRRREKEARSLVIPYPSVNQKTVYAIAGVAAGLGILALAWFAFRKRNRE